MLNKKILLIDDDLDFLRSTSLAFKEFGAQVITANNGMEGISKAAAYSPDLILLDVMMPGVSGFEICKKIRQSSSVPVIILTALNHEHNMLKGFDAGADELMSKPFDWSVLLARANAIMRRSKPENNISRDHFDYNDGYLKLNFDKHRVLIEEQQVRLTPVEYRLLVYLVRNAERVLTFNEILVNVWGNQYKRNKDYVHVYISQLRRKIEVDNKKPRYIQSFHGTGYMFERQDLEPAALM